MSVVAEVPDTGATTWGANVESVPPVAKAGVGAPGMAMTGMSGGVQRRASRRFRHPRAPKTNTSATP